MQVQFLSLDWFIHRLRGLVNPSGSRPFAYVRYGDGEFECITGKQGENCDHTPYTPDLAAALAQTLIHPHDGEYRYAIGPKAMGLPVTAKWVTEKARVREWYDTETFLRASLRGELYPFVQTLANLRVVLVGGAHLANLPVIEPLAHIVVPDADAWGARDRIAAEVMDAAANADVILFSAGMTSKVLMWRLYAAANGSRALGSRVSMLDTGSLWDIYCGKDSRRYARKMDAAHKAQLLRANFGSQQTIRVETEYA